MKRTRKQKLKEREDRRVRSLETKFAILEKLLNLFGIKEELVELAKAMGDEFLAYIDPPLEIVVDPASAADITVEEVRDEIMELVDHLLILKVDGRQVPLSVNDWFRGYRALRELLEIVCISSENAKKHLTAEYLARIRKAKDKVNFIEEIECAAELGRLIHQLQDVADRHLVIHRQIIWYRIERNPRFERSTGFRVVVGRESARKFRLPIDGSYREAYRCGWCSDVRGLKLTTWNPSLLRIGTVNADLPVFILPHALDKYHERLPFCPPFHVLHNQLVRSLEYPTIVPHDSPDSFLVEVGERDRKVGYLVVRVHQDFIVVVTFLFLTMKRTPEGAKLRARLGLSRTDMELFKLDSFFTIAFSDIGLDPDLRNALSDCGCSHLLELVDNKKPLEWLAGHGEKLKKVVGLPPLMRYTSEDPLPARAVSVDDMKKYAEKMLKESQGWIV